MRFDLHYESPEDRRARWWAVVLFYAVVLTIVLGAGWFLTWARDVDPAPTRTPSAPAQSSAWGGPRDR